MKRLSKGVLWLVTLFTVGSMAYAWIASYRTKSASADVLRVADRNGKTVVFSVANRYTRTEI